MSRMVPSYHNGPDVDNFDGDFFTGKDLTKAERDGVVHKSYPHIHNEGFIFVDT